MEAKFKKGDKVRFTDNNGHKVTGTVEGIDHRFPGSNIYKVTAYHTVFERIVDCTVAERHLEKLSPQNRWDDLEELFLTNGFTVKAVTVENCGVEGNTVLRMDVYRGDTREGSFFFNEHKTEMVKP